MPLFQLADTQTQLSIANSRHVREIRASEERSTSYVDISKYNELNAKFLQAEQKLADLEFAMDKRAAETTKLLIGNHY